MAAINVTTRVRNYGNLENTQKNGFYSWIRKKLEKKEKLKKGPKRIIVDNK